MLDKVSIDTLPFMIRPSDKGIIMKALNCPRGHDRMKLRKFTKTVSFRGIEIPYQVEDYICPECGMEAGTVHSAGAIQTQLADGFRKQTGLLTGEEIRSLRKKRGLTQQELADCLKIGVASIKRWENGLIQSKSMDHALCLHLTANRLNDDFSGNRPFSIARIKLVLTTFEKKLGRALLRKTDRMLYAAKYLWYADMMAFRDLGTGMTGAGYAALPLGPQLNNYRDLVEEIKKADGTEAEPLTSEELLIIRKIVNTFPEDRQVYEAAHREKVWRGKPVGAAIPYFEAKGLSEI
jgi:putative zinc finger/helix-turn-helix YgiT family protein